MAEEENVTAKTDIEDCKISDGLNSDEVSKDDTSPSSESSEGVTPSPLSRKARRKQNAKKRQIQQWLCLQTSVCSGSFGKEKVKGIAFDTRS